MITPITRQELAARLDAGEPIVLVEALGPAFYADAHLPGAVNIPPALADALAPELLPDRDADVVVYCSGTCEMALETARRLDALGYSRLWHYAAGKEDWVEAGLPVERDG